MDISKLSPARAPSSAQKVDFIRALALLVDARVPIVQGLAIATQPFVGKELGNILLQVRRRVERGQSLSASFANFSKVFDPLFVQLVSAGEATGNLGEMLNRIADHYERSTTLKRKLSSALAYPATVLVISTISVLFLLVYLVPMFKDMYTDVGHDLPAPTQLLLGFSDVIMSGFGWFLTIGGIAGAFLWQTWYHFRFRVFRERVFSIFPLVGKTTIASRTSRFCRTMGTLLVSGVPLIATLELMLRSSPSVLLSNVLLGMITTVTNGRGLSEFRDEYLALPFLVRQMIRVGEETGQTGKMLMGLADHYEKQALHAIEISTSLLEPILMVAVGSVVGLILVAMYLPMMGLADFVG